MEYFRLGDLEKYITPDLTEKDAKIIGRQLLEGLQLMHKYKLAHRDLKPEKIFVARRAPDWWVKLGDFGISRRIFTEQNGTNYMAPEIFLGNRDEEQDRTYTFAVEPWLCLISPAYSTIAISPGKEFAALLVVKNCSLRMSLWRIMSVKMESPLFSEWWNQIPQTG